VSDGVGFVIDSGVAVAVLDGWPEMLPRGSTSAGSSPNLAVASDVSCSDEAMVPERTDGLLKHRDVLK